MNGREATTTRRGDAVVKTYNAYHHAENDAHRRVPEVHWYRVRPIRDMPLLLASDADSITLAYSGEPIGTPRTDVHPAYRTPELAEWLHRVLSDLTSAGIHHGDIHCGNILYLDGRFTLVDWTWAGPPNPGNPNPTDPDAIAALLEVVCGSLP